MPKVSVITLPAKMLEVQQEIVRKQKNNRLSIKIIFYKVTSMLRQLMSRDDILMSILAFLLGRVLIMGECAPGGLAFFTAVVQINERRAYWVGVWAIVGVISSGSYSEIGIYIIAIGLYFLYADKLLRMKKRNVMIPLFMFFAILCAGLVMSVINEFTLYGTLLMLFEAATCVVLSYIFMYGIPVVENRRKQLSSHTLLNERLSCIIILLAAGVAGLGNVSILEYSIRNITGSLLVMAVAFVGGSGFSAMVGVIVGLVVGLSDGNTTFAISLYGLAGVLSGVFRGLGKLVVIVGFILGSAIATLYFGQGSDLVRIFSECMIAGGLFFLIPNCWLVNWRYRAQQTEEIVSYSTQVNEIIIKMNHIGEIFNDLASEFGTRVTDEKMEIHDDQLAKTLSAIGEQICVDCVKRSQCWEKDFYRTYNGILEIVGQIEVHNFENGNLPKVFQENCIKHKELLETAKLVSERNRMLTFWHKKIIDNKQMVAEQMKAASEIVKNLSYELEKVEDSDQKLSVAFQEKANILGCQLTAVRVRDIQKRGLIEACKKPCTGNRECMNTILPLAAGLMKEKMTLHTECGNEYNKQKCKLTMQVARRFHVSTGIATVAKDGQEICGDNYAVIELNRGKMAFILSDGMGSGHQAATQSTMAIGFLRKLLVAGFDTDVAVKTVNAMLLLHSPEESFATIDITVIDTYSGNAEFLKIGSAPSFIKRVREVSTIRSSSLPVGILEQIEIQPTQSIVVGGDFIVMVSDGIVDVPQSQLDKGNWLANFLRQSVQSNPQIMANQILARAKMMSGNRVCDDMTVLVVKISEQSHEKN
ncbi:stage II sporulation protein E [Pelosinus sp. sgz500959]|uniref:stage II sporulation protein E n=1 Tax=Pelosinus sp. sgz500959 TaxID=3242472 RepID=UPI00366E32AA